MNPQAPCFIPRAAVAARVLDTRAPILVLRSTDTSSKSIPIGSPRAIPAEHEHEHEQEGPPETLQESSKPRIPTWMTLFPPALQYITSNRLFADFDTNKSSTCLTIPSHPPSPELRDPTPIQTEIPDPEISLLNSSSSTSTSHRPQSQPQSQSQPRPSAFEQICKEIDNRLAFSNGRFRDHSIVYTRGAAWIRNETAWKARDAICRNRSKSF